MTQPPIEKKKRMTRLGLSSVARAVRRRGKQWAKGGRSLFQGAASFLVGPPTVGAIEAEDARVARAEQTLTLIVLLGVFATSLFQSNRVTSLFPFAEEHPVWTLLAWSSGLAVIIWSVARQRVGFILTAILIFAVWREYEHKQTVTYSFTLLGERLSIWAAVVALFTAGLIYWLAPGRGQSRPDTAESPADAEARLAAARQHWAKMLAGLLVGLGVFTAASEKLDSLINQKSADRYTEAVSRLTDRCRTNHTEEIYTLEFLARESPKVYEQQVEITLAAFVRNPTSRWRLDYESTATTFACRPPVASAASTPAISLNPFAVDDPGVAFDSDQTEDVHVALKVLGRLGRQHRSDPCHDVTGAVLIGFDGRNGNFERLCAAGAKLMGADLRGANLRDSDLRNANLANANLAGANLSGADLSGTTLDGANFVDADLARANFERSNLTDSQLRFAANADGAMLPPSLTGSTESVVATYRANESRTGRQPGPKPSIDQLGEEWRFTSTGGTPGAPSSAQVADTTSVCYGPNDQKQPLPILSSPIVALNNQRQLTLYFTSTDGCLYDVDVNTGRSRWPKPFKAPNATIESSPTYFRGVIYITTSNGFVYAVDATSGRSLWGAPGASRFSSPLVAIIADVPTVYVGGTSELLAFDARTGEKKSEWHFLTRPGCGDLDVWSSPAIGDGVVYLTTTRGCVYAVDAATGRPQWIRVFARCQHVERGTSVLFTPVVSGEFVFFGGEDGSLYALNTSNGEKAWCRTLDGPVDHASPAVADGIAYMVAGGHVYAFRASDGTAAWTENKYIGRILRSSPAVVDGRVYLGTAYTPSDCPAVSGIPAPTNDPQRNVCGLIILDATTGDLVGIAPTEGDVMDAPIVLNGRVYVTDSDGFVYAFEAVQDEDDDRWWDFLPFV